MPYVIDWHVENHIIYARHWGKATKEDLRSFILDIHRFASQSDKVLVHTISDTSEVTENLTLKDTLEVVREVGAHPRIGWSITIGEKNIIEKFISSVARQLFKIRQRSFDSFEEAVAFLKEMDTTIDWDKANSAMVIHTAVDKK